MVVVRTRPSETVKSKTTLAAHRWYRAVPGRSLTKTGCLQDFPYRG